MQLEELIAAFVAQRERFQARWAAGLSQAGVALPAADPPDDRLRSLTDQLIVALAAPDQAARTAFGHELVRADLRSPEALSATLVELRATLWAALPDPTPRPLAQRVEALLSGIALGFYEATSALSPTTWEQMDRQAVGVPNGLEAAFAQQADALRADNQALAKADRRKDELIAVLSHELRTPLSIILGLAELLADGAYGPISAQQADQVAQIDRSGRHLLSFVNDVLDLAHLSAGLIALSYEPVDLALVCQTSVAAISFEAQSRSITLDLELNVQVTTIVADRRRLHEILTRLLSNAVRFTPEGGRAGLRVSDEPARRRSHFLIWDTGSGVVPTHIDRLFRPFDQLDSGMARQGGGLGLGLALVASLARLHDGEVSVQSEVGQGSRFSVWLPWEQPEMSDE